jgi:hypothetical protein
MTPGVQITLIICVTLITLMGMLVWFAKGK